MGLKPLGIIKEIAEACGIGISYAYDDLVFVDHNAFLFEFTEKNNEIIIHINTEADEQYIAQSISLINNAAASRDIVFVKGRYYSLVQADDDNVRLVFTDSKE